MKYLFSFTLLMAVMSANAANFLKINSHEAKRMYEKLDGRGFMIEGSNGSNGFRSHLSCHHASQAGSGDGSVFDYNCKVTNGNQSLVLTAHEAKEVFEKMNGKDFTPEGSIGGTYFRATMVCTKSTELAGANGSVYDYSCSVIDVL